MLNRRSFLGTTAAAALAQSTYPPVLEGARVETYKTVGETALRLWIYSPAKKAEKPAAGIVFFFGGGWANGTPKQFEQHCKKLAARGMVAMTADYRVSSRHQSTVADSVRDAKSAMRWVRAQAAELGVDPERLAAGGGSAGGHLAAATALLPGLDDPADDRKVSARPQALVLFNPVVVLAAAPETGFELNGATAENWKKRAGTELEQISPYHHVSGSAPPTIIFHGRADTTVPYSTVEAFTKKMKGAGARCELVGYDDQQHGFFNYGRNGDVYYRRTLKAADEFLTSCGYLEPVAE